MENLKKQNAITLIALIITIILLLILAGVTISLLTGENSILKYAKSSSERYAIEQGKERIELILAEVNMQDIVSKTKTGIDDLVILIKGKEGIASAEKIDDTTIKVTTSEGYEYEVTIDEDGKTEVKHTGESEDLGKEETLPPDEIAPEVSLEITNLTNNAVTLLVTATDEGSGLAESETYKYYLDDELKYSSTTNNYVYTKLSSETTYTLKVIVTDKEGNETEKTVEIETETVIDQKITQGTRTAPIPKGYVASTVTGENTINNGLVIYEGTEAVTSTNHSTALTTRNQYIWIPVDNINSMCMCSSNAEGSVCNLQLQTDGILKCTVHSDTATEIVGRLYREYTETRTTEQNSKGTDITIISKVINFNQTNQEYISSAWGYASGYKEPGIIAGLFEVGLTGPEGTEYDADEINNYHGYGTGIAFLKVMQEEYIAMATSVAKNGGFYVSRYEIGTNGISIKNQEVINAGESSQKNWYGLYKVAKNANTILNSHMIWRQST